MVPPEDLQSLVDRARTLHDSFNDEINNGVGWCRFCAANGPCFDFVEAPPMEREGLMEISDSLKKVLNFPLHLQRLQSNHHMERQKAAASLEESRAVLKEHARQYRGRRLEVVEELSAFCGKEIAASKWNLEGNLEGKLRERKPWKWQVPISTAVKLTIASAGISAVLQFFKAKHSLDSPAKAAIFKATMDVLCGRG